ncbi:MAG: V-type ATP synthase subunit E family protein [Candidatus Altiarchaeota archaeon]|nr:V-type ATP synthase subunit E family protein [Candidatus Altiarchaeota archaeon]
MGLEELESRIMEDAEKQIRKINEEANRKIEDIREEIERDANQEAEKILKKGKQEANLTYRRIIADIIIKGKDRIEKRENSIIDDAFGRVRNAILESSDPEKRKFLGKLIERDRNKVHEPQMMVDVKYANLIEEAKAGDIGDFGVVIQSRDGKMRIDNTLNNRINRLKTTLRPEISSMLFG